MSKIILLDRLEEILHSVNNTLIKEIYVKPTGSQYGHIDYVAFTIGNTTYDILVMDLDNHYNYADIARVEETIKKFSDRPYNFIVEPVVYYVTQGYQSQNSITSSGSLMNIFGGGFNVFEGNGKLGLSGYDVSLDYGTINEYFMLTKDKDINVIDNNHIVDGKVEFDRVFYTKLNIDEVITRLKQLYSVYYISEPYISVGNKNNGELIGLDYNPYPSKVRKLNPNFNSYVNEEKLKKSTEYLLAKGGHIHHPDFNTETTLIGFYINDNDCNVIKIYNHSLDQELTIGVDHYIEILKQREVIINKPCWVIIATSRFTNYWKNKYDCKIKQEMKRIKHSLDKLNYLNKHIGI